MTTQISIERSGNRFVLCKEKVAYWEDQDALLLADVHAGKAALFRANGIPLSSDHLLQDLIKIEGLIDRFNAKRLIILGDLFHSSHNEENALVVDWISKLKVESLLVEGNHDLHSAKGYGMNKIPELLENGLKMVHEPLPFDGNFQINGHIHPAYRIKGKAKQSFKLPCFFLTNERLILPAFGQLTGSKSMKKKKGDQAIIVGPNGLMLV